MYDLIVGCTAVMAMPFWTCYRRLRSSPLVSGSGFSVGIPLRSLSGPTSVLTRYLTSRTYVRTDPKHFGFQDPDLVLSV
jgi:hypothetical protein